MGSLWESGSTGERDTPSLCLLARGPGHESSAGETLTFLVLPYSAQKAMDEDDGNSKGKPFGTCLNPFLVEPLLTKDSVDEVGNNDRCLVVF